MIVFFYPQMAKKGLEEFLKSSNSLNLFGSGAWILTTDLRVMSPTDTFLVPLLFLGFSRASRLDVPPSCH